MKKFESRHQRYTCYNWKKFGIKFTEEEFFYIYGVYMTLENCMDCNKQFTKNNKVLDHNHSTGEIRGIICRSCNYNKLDTKIPSNNTSGYRNIRKNKSKTAKQGFMWEFMVKNKLIKCSTDLEYLKNFSEKWFEETYT